MRLGKYGNKFSLEGDIADILCDELPDTPPEDMDTYKESDEFNKMVDKIVSKVREHVIYCAGLITDE